jgi:hypothetical protein
VGKIAGVASLARDFARPSMRINANNGAPDCELPIDASYRLLLTLPES